MADENNPLKLPNPLELIKEAVARVPSVKYALAVAAVAACASFITLFVGKERSGFIILGTTFIAMILMFIFVRLSVSKSKSIVYTGLALIWTSTIFFIFFVSITMSVFIIEKPVTWAKFIGIYTDKSEVKSGKSYKQDVLLSWICSNMNTSFDFDDAALSFPIQEFSKNIHYEFEDAIDPDNKFYQRTRTAYKSEDYGITYLYNMKKGENIDSYEHRLVIDEKDSAKDPILQANSDRVIFLSKLKGQSFSSMAGLQVYVPAIDNPRITIQAPMIGSLWIDWRKSDDLRFGKLICNS